jgi:glycosyltransferase involved in cell wall biosynthesis
MSSSPPFLSLVIPAYNEADRLPETLRQVAEHARSQPRPLEVLVVDNASSDGTAALVRAAAAEMPFLRLLHEPRRGKGAAVRTGALAAAGEHVFFADADLSMPLAEVTNFLPPVLEGVDLAVGSREAPGAVRYDEPVLRHLMGRAFNLLVRWTLLPGIHDTQCGFKCFTRRAAQDLFRAQTLADWAFDVELLFLARRRGYRIVEVPVHWRYRANSRIHPLRDSLRMLRGLCRVRWNSWRGVYGPKTRQPPDQGASQIPRF